MKCGLCSKEKDKTQSEIGWVFVNMKSSSKMVCPLCVFAITLELENRLYAHTSGSWKVVMVTGGREYKNKDRVYQELDSLHCHGSGIKRLVVGDARGLDYLAVQWALDRCVSYKVYKAKWDEQKKAAGPKRNSRMIKKGKPDVCLSFPGGKGTEDATNKAIKAGVKVYHVLD